MSTNNIRILKMIENNDLVSNKPDSLKAIKVIETQENIVDPDDFVKIFKNRYFVQGKESEIENDELLNCPRNIIRTPRWIENIIIEIMYKVKWNPIDVFQIIAWKTGNIDYKKSTILDNKKYKIEYKAGWDDSALTARLSNKKDEYVKIESFAQKIVKIKEKNKNEESKPEEIWEELVDSVSGDNNVSGIGPVYLITLLYFITKGEYPIYDRFAMAALLSFEINKKSFFAIPNQTTLVIKQLPDKSSKKIKNMLNDENSYTEYRRLLNKYFDEKWKVDRDIDRALWVYGHYYKVL